VLEWKRRIEEARRQLPAPVPVEPGRLQVEANVDNVRQLRDLGWRPHRDCDLDDRLNR
jgi:hypothetical protein